MAAPSFTLDMDPDSLRRMFKRYADQPALVMLALAGLGVLFGDLAPDYSPIGDPAETLPHIQFGDFPPKPPFDTSCHEGPGTTEEKVTSPRPLVQKVETRTVVDEAKKHEDDDKNMRCTDGLPCKIRNEMGYQRRMALRLWNKEEEEKKEKRGNNKSPQAKRSRKNPSGSDKPVVTPSSSPPETNPPSRAPSRRKQGLDPENNGLPSQRSRPKKTTNKNHLAERPALSQNIDEQATEIETVDKPANIDTPASVNETVEKTTGNG
eukprot:CAMPEP_0185743024 /NCGR_PEP_ID=MMETSP1174-20130828/577_1 /TAXON_ID=35687 /ORGANISM="Dictyocha speculum, Strain CCMP1381" /LENGTH=263 /DNA_ID=CAMNT_0028415393 /DNA_START=59 /DNA_END=846 /DNA_ORIENTATION=-